MNTGMESPPRIWWKPVHGAEKLWVGIAFAWCLILFAMMPFWHLRGGQNPTGIRHRVDPAAFAARVDEFIATYQVGEDRGMPIVEPPPGSDVYLLASMWTWRPILRLQKDAEYVLHLSARDVNHGFSLLPLNVNLQVIPGYDYGLRVTPTEAGDFRVVCNEFCGVGHHLMIGRVIVIDAAQPDVAAVNAEGAPRPLHMQIEATQADPNRNGGPR
jgi:cytochrome c oxidase subunit II